MWDFSLVDPDNRRPVDFKLRAACARRSCEHAEQSGDRVALCQELLRNYHDGRIKMWVTMCALNLRRDRKRLFQLGSYLPLQVIHGKEEHVVAFARVHGTRRLSIAAPRLSYTLMKGREEPPIGRSLGRLGAVAAAGGDRQTVAQCLYRRNPDRGAVAAMPRSLRELPPGLARRRVTALSHTTSRSVTSTRVAIFLASSGVSASARRRQDQLIAGFAGNIHSRLAAEPEHILHGNDAQIGDRGQRRANERPTALRLRRFPGRPRPVPFPSA